jgi:hypothetical protein
VQHAEKAWRIAADELGIGRQALDRRRRSGKQSAVADALMTEDGDGDVAALLH